MTLIQDCDAHFRPKRDGAFRLALESWRHAQAARVARQVESLMRMDPRDWQVLIEAHDAARHPWYDELRAHADAATFGAFLREEKAMPAFIPLLTAVGEAQALPSARRAVEENIADEHRPVPHSELFARLLAASERRGAGSGTFDSVLDDTNLVFYYGYFACADFAAGALYATELMLHRRASAMLAGLTRLGFDAHESEFMRIHAACDEEHAAQWLAALIVPSAVDPRVKRAQATGIAVRLATSARYLDRLQHSLKSNSIEVAL